MNPLLPPDAVPLGVEGFFITSRHNEYGYKLLRFNMYRVGQYDRVINHEIAIINFPRPVRWRVPRPDELRTTATLRPMEGVGPDNVRVLAEVYDQIANLLVFFNAGIEDQIKAAEAAMQAELEQRRQAEQIRREEQKRWSKEAHRRRLQLDARRAHLHELLKWMPEEKIKLTRDSHRSTVFGTIERITETGIDVTTEKGKWMRINFRDVNALWHKPEHERRYEVLYKAGDEPTVQEEEVSS